MKRPKGFEEGEFIPRDVSEKDLREEMNYHSWKAGHTTRFGECPRATKIMTTVPLGKTKLNVWPRNEQGQLIGD